MALHYAVRNKLLVEVRSLVENGTNVNARDTNGLTALMLCCIEDDKKFAAGIARMLLQAGAKVGTSDKKGRNSLMFASIYGRRELSNLFLKAIDFSLEKRDSFENTALHFAALNGNAEVAGQLLNAFKRSGANVNERNRMGQTAAALALQLGHVNCVEVFRRKEFSACFSTKIPSVLLMRSWSEDLKYIRNPNLMLQQTANELSVAADMHKSRSNFNIHQFRRGTPIPQDRMLKKRKRNAWRRNIQSASSRFDSRVGYMSLLPGNCPSPPFSLYTNESPKKNSWKNIVHELLDVLRVQISPSYRTSAVGIPQTYEDIFHPKELPITATIELDDAAEKQCSPGTDQRRKSASSTPRLKIKAEVGDGVASQPEGKRKGRRCSLQVSEGMPTLQRRKTLNKLVL